MIKLYKLTDRDGQTFGGTQWGPGVSHSGTGKGELCGPGWIHAYEHPLVAVLMNPIHANFKNPRLWEAEGEVGLRDGQLKCGCKTLTTIREIPLPEITMEMRVRFTILCAKEVCACSEWNAWGDKWLSGEDRTLSAAAAAYRAAMAARASAAAMAAETAAAMAAMAAMVAEAAAYRAEAYRAEAAARAARVAEAAEAEAAEAACCCMDLAAIAENACSGLT